MKHIKRILIMVLTLFQPATLSAQAAPRESRSVLRTIAPIIVGVVVVSIAIGLYLYFSKPSTTKLTKHDMEVLVNESISPKQPSASYLKSGNRLLPVISLEERQQLASYREKKRDLVKVVRTMLAVAYKAELEGYGERPEVKAQVAHLNDVALYHVYMNKHPDVKASDEEVDNYLFVGHPLEFPVYLEIDRGLQEAIKVDIDEELTRQRRDPMPPGMEKLIETYLEFETGAKVRERIRKEFAEIKVLAQRARQEGFEKEEATRVLSLFLRIGALARAYINDLNKATEKLITNTDIEKYYNEHKSKFSAPPDSSRIRQAILERLKEEKIRKHIDDITASSRVQVADDFEINTKPPAGGLRKQP